MRRAWYYSGEAKCFSASAIRSDSDSPSVSAFFVGAEPAEVDFDSVGALGFASSVTAFVAWRPAPNRFVKSE